MLQIHPAQPELPDKKKSDICDKSLPKRTGAILVQRGFNQMLIFTMYLNFRKTQ